MRHFRIYFKIYFLEMALLKQNMMILRELVPKDIKVVVQILMQALRS